jgi:hypothetical protein
MRNTNRNHQTQWAAQFAVASELCKMGYEVSFTLGDTAADYDLVAISPRTKTALLVDVKGLYRKNGWVVQPKPRRKNLFYVLVYVPLGSANEFYVFSQQTMNQCIRSELARLKRASDYRIKGMSWSLAQQRGGSLTTLPL